MSVDTSNSIVINRPRDVVARYAANPDYAPEWYINIKAVEWMTTPPVAVGSHIAFVAHFLGRRMAYTYEVVEFVPGERLVIRTAQGPFPMETSYTWDTTADGSTRMTLRNRGTPQDSQNGWPPFSRVRCGGPIEGTLLRSRSGSNRRTQAETTGGCHFDAFVALPIHDITSVRRQTLDEPPLDRLELRESAEHSGLYPCVPSDTR